MLKLLQLSHQRLSVLYNHFAGLTKLFSDLYLVKFLLQQKFIFCTQIYIFINLYNL